LYDHSELINSPLFEQQKQECLCKYPIGLENATA
jgi:hypothetical protein